MAWDPRAHSHSRWWWARRLVLRKHMGRSLLGAPSPATAGANPGPRVRWITDLSTATTSPGSITWPSPLLLIMFTAHVPSFKFLKIENHLQRGVPGRMHQARGADSEDEAQMSDSRPLLVDGSSGSIQGSDAQREFTPQESSLGPAATTTLLTESPWRLMLMGQCVSLLLCGTAVFSEYLAGHNFNAPTTQSLLNYSLLLLVYIPVLYRRGRLRKLLSSSWVWFLVLAVVDVEANFVIVKAYEYVLL